MPKDAYYAGQAIEVRVGVVAGGERPKVVPPRIDGAEVAPIDAAFRQLGASGIGDVVAEKNLFISRFRVVAATPGPLTIPPFHARLGEASGTSGPIRLTIRPVPAEGRPASYLRGVGRVDVRAEAEPASVRVGQAFEYRLILGGPGSRGSTQWPTLPAIEGVGGVHVTPDRSDLVADPPSRTFRYRVRPTRPGELVLGSVPVATFDPALKRFNEARAPSVKVRVVDVPRLDPATVPGGPDPTPAGDATGLVVVWAALAAVAATVLLARRTPRARRFARRFARELAKFKGPDLAGLVAEGLTRYLSRAIGRPEGVLTPEEAARGVLEAVGDVGLADRAGRLIARSDRARFGDDLDPSSGLAEEASAVFEGLARKRTRARRFGP